MSNYKFRIAEIILSLITLGYFLVYPRNTLSDFIALSILCLLLIFSGTKIKLPKPTIFPFSKMDIFLAFLSLFIFSAAWIYGFKTERLDIDSGLESLCITVIYFYYAWIQHFLAQRYLSLRMLGFSKKININSHPKITAALMSGFLFGILHIPYPNLMLPSALGGFLFSYYFLKTGRLWAVVCSHALISSAGLFWFLGDNPFMELIDIF